MSDVLRILDANANRAREALRVMEEAARFLLNDADLTQAVKTLRHDLAAALSGACGLQAHRDTPGDVGTQIATDSEQTRASATEVVVAAGKRLSEALRAIEEYAKTLSQGPPNLAASVEQLRYRGYDLEKRLSAAMPTGRAPQWRVCVLLTGSLCRLPWQDVLDQALNAGADCVQLREKDLGGAELLDRASHMAERCRAAGAASIVNDRPDAALLSGADGVHVGQTDLPVPAVRRLAGRRLLVGVSTSCLGEARAARAAGADYAGVGPMFATTTKHKPVLAGPEYLAAYLDDEALRGLPHLAIGGIAPDNMAALVAAGVGGVAVSSAVCASQRPGEAVRRLLQAWD